MSAAEIDPTAIRDSVAGALAGAGLLVTKWVLVAEVLPAEGEKELIQCVPEGLTLWDALGMLTYALHNDPEDDE